MMELEDLIFLGACCLLGGRGVDELREQDYGIAITEAKKVWKIVIQRSKDD